MNAIIKFYQELDTLNLILFWGVIIVIILLLIFSIILVNKNKKLKAMLTSNKLNIDANEDIEEITDVPVPIVNNVNIETQTEYISPSNETNNEMTVHEEKVPEEKDFIAEEHVMEYNKELFSLQNIKKAEPVEEPKQPIIEKDTKIDLPNAPYQRNVLREMSLNQTSPIGIIKRNTPEEKHLKNAEELQTALNGEISNEEFPDNKLEDNTAQKEYLTEVSQKLSEASNLNDIERTSYELQQEEDAIISYQELMAKKDSIHIVDEEDAVISIGELINRKRQEEKLYNITKEEENNTFIDELKNLRHDL